MVGQNLLGTSPRLTTNGQFKTGFELEIPFVSFYTSKLRFFDIRQNTMFNVADVFFFFFGVKISSTKMTLCWK